MTDQNHNHWHEKLHEALWAYRMTYRTPTQATPYSLMSLWCRSHPPSGDGDTLAKESSEEGLTKEEQTRLRLEELDAADSTRLNAQLNLELDRARMEGAYNKMARMRTTRRICPRVKTTRPMIGRHMGPKLAPPLGKGPVILEVLKGGAYQLINKEGERPCERLVLKEVPR